MIRPPGVMARVCRQRRCVCRGSPAFGSAGLLGRSEAVQTFVCRMVRRFSLWSRAPGKSCGPGIIADGEGRPRVRLRSWGCWSRPVPNVLPGSSWPGPSVWGRRGRQGRAWADPPPRVFGIGVAPPAPRRTGFDAWQLLRTDDPGFPCWEAGA